MKLGDYDISNPLEAKLVSSERITPNDAEAEVKHLVLELPGSEFDFVEGQSIGVLAPGSNEFGNEHHLRLYSIASTRQGENGCGNAISVCVRRCFYIDEINGERYPGRASNYLCDASPGDTILVTGPYGAHFAVPPDDTCNMLMIGVGTGIAPFRAFIKHIYDVRGGWKGNVRLFYGAKTGMELLYMNDARKDLALYYDKESFKAFEAVSPRPHADQTPAIDRLLVENAVEVWALIRDPKTYVYLAGLPEAAHKFEKAMIIMAGSEDGWRRVREDLIDNNRYAELIY